MQCSDSSIELHCPKPGVVAFIEDIEEVGGEKVCRNPFIEPCCIIYSNAACMGIFFMFYHLD